jgi:hypothetical protein
MGEPLLKSMFSEKKKEQTPGEKEKEMADNNPFLLGPGKKPKLSNKYGHSLNPQYGHEGALRFILEDMTSSIEKHYYFFQKVLRPYDKAAGAFGSSAKSKEYSATFGIAAVEMKKLKDTFDASVSSAFHGQVGSKISAMQQQVSTYLAQIGQLTKTLLPMIREIRMMDERMEMYKLSLSGKPGDDTARQNEIALKSTWIEVVEQGIQSPNSVYSLGTKVGFTILPDLFFSVNPHGKTPADQKKLMNKTIAAMEKQLQFNKKVRDVLAKKLVQYYTWKEKTWQEMQHSRKFRLKNLQQHYNVIKLYTSWLKPNLTALKALQLKADVKSRDLVMSFESSKLELELLAVLAKKKGWNSCLLIRITHLTKPELHYTQSGQKQPTHTGQTYISIEPYVATDESVKWYEEYCDKYILNQVSGSEIDFANSITDILKSYGSDVDDYLYEAEHGKKKSDEEAKKAEKAPLNLFEPFEGLFDSVKIFKPDFNSSGTSKEKKEAIAKSKAKKSVIKGPPVETLSWILYQIFKKLNGMLDIP